MGVFVETGPCAWVEPDLCDNCDALIEALAADIDRFTAGSVAARDQSKEDHPRYTAAVNRALSEASGRLRRFHSQESVEVQAVEEDVEASARLREAASGRPLILVVRG
jgi:hypothetical protein